MIMFLPIEAAIMVEMLNLQPLIFYKWWTLVSFSFQRSTKVIKKNIFI